MKMIRLIAIIKKEFIHIFRDKASLIIVLGMPIVFSILFGFAVTTEVDEIPIAVLDNDKTIESREYINSFKNSNYFVINQYVTNMKKIENLIDENTIKGALIIQSGYSKDKSKYNENKSLLIIDGSDPTVAKTALQSGTLVSSFHEVNKIIGIDINNFGINTKVWYNPNLESTKFIMPGLIGIIMQNITILLTAFSLVREKEKGNIELLIVSPIKPSELILGKMVPYVIIGFIDFLITLFFGIYYFNVPIVGSFPLLLLLGFIFVLSALAMGMLISTVADNQLQAMQISFVTILPSVLLSGFIFPREAMPLIIQKIGYLIPVTYFLKILRGIILKGTNLEQLIFETISLVAITIILLSMAIIKFNKTLD